MSFLDARSFLIEVLEHSLDGVLAVDAQGHVVVWNTEVERMFGKSKSSVIGHPLFDVLSFLRETGEDWSIREALAGRAANSPDQKYFVPETGREGWYQSRFVPLRDARGEIVGALGFLRDRTDEQLAIIAAKREAQEEIQALKRQIKGGPTSGAAGTARSASRAAPPRPRTGPTPVRTVPPNRPPRTAPVAAGPAAVGPVFDPEAALEIIGDAGALQEFIQGFVLSLPEFVRQMDHAVTNRDLRTVGDQAEDVKQAAETLGGIRAARSAALLVATVKKRDPEEVERVWWRLRRELAVLRETVRTFRKTA